MRTALILALLAGAGCGGPELDDRLDLDGVWEGTATFTNNCVNPACRWPARLTPPTVVFDLLHVSNKVTGSTTLDLPQGDVLIAGNPCGPAQGSVNIFDGTVDGTRLTITTFSGGAQQTWDLRATTDLIEGTFLSDVTGCNGLEADDVSVRRQF